MEVQTQISAKNYKPTIILGLSAGITTASVLYILSNLCLPFMCSEPSEIFSLASYGIFNPIILFPLAYLFSRGYKSSKLLIGVNICLAILAVFPILLFVFSFINTSIALKNSEYAEARNREIQLSQINLAKQGDIEISAGDATLSLINQPNKSLDEYNLTIPLIVHNVPDGLNSFNIGCEAIEISENFLPDKNKFHPECTYLMARKVNGIWTYKTYSWSWQDYVVTQTVSDKLEINARFTSVHNVPLPDFKLAHIIFYVPFDFDQYTSPKPGGLSIENSTIIDKRLKLNILKGQN